MPVHTEFCGDIRKRTDSYYQLSCDVRSDKRFYPSAAGFGYSK